MIATDIGYALTGFIGLAIIFIGARFLIAPSAAAAGYGIAESGNDAYLSVKGIRDIASGLIAIVLLAARMPHPLGWFMVAACTIPIGDAVIVLRHDGSKAIALGVHAATGAVMLATAVLLLAAPR